MAQYTIVVNTADGTVPFVSGTPRESLNRLRDVLKRLASGATRVGTNTLAVRNTAVAASAIVTCAAVQAADTVTINGTALTATQHNATGTVTITASGVDLDDTVTINGAVFTAKAAQDLTLGYFTFAADNASATSLGACINASTSALISGVVTAQVATNVVTIRAVAGGTAGNSITLVSSDAQLAVSGATLASGAAVANNQFDYVGTNTETGTALVNALAASSTSIVSGHVSGSNASGAVTISAKVPGVAGNAITIATSNGTRLAITGGLSRLGSGSETALSYSF